MGASGMWKVLISGAVLTAALTGCAEPPHEAAPAGVPPDPALSGLAELAAQRILLADKVAAAKFGTPQPIEDPPREQQVLDAAAAASPPLGLDPAESTRFFRDQIEASKVVQRGWYADWTAHPERRPATRPDLGAEVRPQLDRITGEVLRRLADTRELRHDAAACRSRLPSATAPVAGRLDALHRAALDTALRSVCAERG